jgi:hypothetical protein
MGVSGVTAVDQAANRGLAGPILFVRYAFPPNHRGYCGPADSTGFFEHGVAGTAGPGLRELSIGWARRAGAQLPALPPVPHRIPA